MVKTSFYLPSFHVLTSPAAMSFKPSRQGLLVLIQVSLFFFKSLLISLPLCQLSHFHPCRGIKKRRFLMLAPPLVTCQRAVIVQSIGTEVCMRRWCSAQHLSSPCNRQESNQPLTAPASSICSEAEERGSHQSQKRSSWETDQHPDLCQNLTLSLTDTP